MPEMLQGEQQWLSKGSKGVLGRAQSLKVCHHRSHFQAHTPRRCITVIVSVSMLVMPAGAAASMGTEHVHPTHRVAAAEQMRTP